MRNRGDIERLGSSDPASTANESVLVANSTGRSLRAKVASDATFDCALRNSWRISITSEAASRSDLWMESEAPRCQRFKQSVYFLLIWTAVSVPLGLLLAAVIKFGAGEGLPPDQIDREFGTPSPVRQRDSVVAEKRTMATILFFRKKSARQSRRKRLQLGRIAVGRPRSEDGHDGKGVWSSRIAEPRLGARRQLRDAQKTIELVRRPNYRLGSRDPSVIARSPCDEAIQGPQHARDPGSTAWIASLRSQ